MKQVLVILFTGICALSCNDKNTASTPTITDSTTTAAPPERLDYPYTLDHPYQDWQPGNQQHAVMVMKSLKAYENGNIEECIQGFGDSVTIMFDGYQARLSKDSLINMFVKSRCEVASVVIKMGDWESVISKDKKDEYVTLWYKKIETDKRGKTDSLSVIDDLKIVNGKIIELDQKIQHFSAVKNK